MTDMTVLVLISHIGESLSVFCLIVTLCIFTTFRRSLKSERIIAHFHLAASLLMFHLIQLFSYEAENSKNTTAVPCIIVAFITHFTLLSTFMWMLCEGITLYLSVIDVFGSMKVFKYLRYLIGWGIPLLIASASLAWGLSLDPHPTCYLQGVGTQSCSFSEDHEEMDMLDADPSHQLIEKCWLSTESHLIWALVAPAFFVLCLNLVVLLRVSFVISQSSKATNQHHRPSSDLKQDLRHIRKSLKGAAILMPMLGIPWVFGFIPQSLTHVSLLYTFTLLNSTQGFFILLFYCILNTEVRSVMERCIKQQRLFNQQTWSSQSNARNQSLDLRLIHKSDVASDPKMTSVVQRSVSTNTTSTFCENMSTNKEENDFWKSSAEDNFLSAECAPLNFSDFDDVATEIY